MTQEPLPLKGLKVRIRICKECVAAAPEERPKGHPLKAPHEGPRCHRHHQARVKARRLQRHENDSQTMYGMPSGFFRRLLAYQGHACGGCGRKLIRVQRDHDHRIDDPAKAIRGLLCRKCNDYLGYIRDDQDVLRRLLRYLKDPPAQVLLMAWDADEPEMLRQEGHVDA